MMTETQALARLKRDTAPTSEPKMSDDELKDCLADTMRARVWAVSTVYEFGDRVVTGNGRIYRCSVAGTSGTAVSNKYLQAGSPWGDGTVIWQDVGPASAEIYNLKAATNLAWTRKAGKVAEQINFSSDGKRFELEALHKNCLRMAGKYQPVVVA